MSKSIKRKILVNGKIYRWTLNGNSIDGNMGKEEHIRIHTGKSTKSILYLDPYNWHFEIRPRTIQDAILFAIKHGWKPEEKAEKLYLSFNEDGFYILPNGQKFGHKANINNQ